MKIVSLLTLAGAAVTFAALPSFALDTPLRASGLWEVTMKSSAGVPAMKTKQCVDEKTDSKMQATGQEMIEKMGGTCAKVTMEKTADGYAGDSDCTVQGSRMISKTTFVGDMNTSYTATIVTKYDPPFMGQSDGTVELSGKFLGPCEAGMVPGDMTLPNGSKVNVLKLGKGAKTTK